MAAAGVFWNPGGGRARPTYTSVKPSISICGAGVPAWLGLVAGGLLTFVWITTALVQVPLHRRLGVGLDRAVLARLVASNWLRTLAWSVRAVLGAVMIAAPT